MKRSFIYLSFALIAILILSDFTAAENWPCWRGPRGDGTSLEKDIPIRWDAATNIIWKTTLPGTGQASPIVWGNRIFTTTAIPEKQQRILLCLDRETGGILWQKIVLDSPLEKKHNDNSFASGTPATDGEKVYVSFLDGKDVVVSAYDFSGKQIWLVRPGTFESPHGFSCSPVLFEDKVIINGDSKGDAFMAALSCDDGRTLWKIPHENRKLSYSTPLMREIDGRIQIIHSGNQSVAGYNPNDGSLYWIVDGPSEEFVASPVYSDITGLVYISSGYPQRHLLAIKPNGSGNVTQTHIAWRTTEGAYYVPSPICAGDYLLTTNTSGEVHCFEAATGKILWKERLGRQYSSPVLIDGFVFIPNDDGVVSVIRPGPTFELVAQNAIGEKMNTSLTVSNGRIFLRGEAHLFCIGKLGKKDL